jgi:hypothetical protein
MNFLIRKANNSEPPHNSIVMWLCASFIVLTICGFLAYVCVVGSKTFTLEGKFGTNETKVRIE